MISKEIISIVQLDIMECTYILPNEDLGRYPHLPSMMFQRVEIVEIAFRRFFHTVPKLDQ